MELRQRAVDNYMKKILLISSTIIIFGLVLFVWLFQPDEVIQEEEIQQPIPTASIERPAVANGSRMVQSEDGFMPITDVTIDPVAVYDGGVVVFHENEEFSMLYYASIDHFLVSLLRVDDFTAARAYAEDTFLSTLGITKKEACALSVDVVVPPYVDPELSDSYGLSFCVNAKAIPQEFTSE
ncbi:MAG: hypothetical protein ACI92I_000518 [Acidimicrobiales bacterium]|jgi:hypothetical protein